jgi:hypothetical protein
VFWPGTFNGSIFKKSKRIIMDLIEPLVWIVIPTRNRSADLIDCINSVKKQTYHNKKIVVVDNNSEDDSLEILHSIFPNIDILCLKRNFGASYATNRGFEFALNHEAKFVLRLDSDTILDEEYLTKLIEIILMVPDTAIVSGTIFYYSEPESIWFTGANLTKFDLNAKFLNINESDNGLLNQYYEVDLLPSTGMLISRETIEQLNGFDEDYLVYYEDFDFCLRTKKTGKKIIYVPGAKMWHKIFSNKKSVGTAFIWNKSKMIYYRKHATNIIHLGFLVIYAISYAFFRACFPKEDRGNRGPLIPTIKGLVKGLFIELNTDQNNN